MPFTGKILLVDDEPHVRKFVALIARQALGTKHSLVEASDGDQALELYQSTHPDLVLLDVNMPRRDGIETLRALREIDPEVAVVMLTSLTNRQTIEQAAELGAIHYLRKDTPKDEIAATLASIVESLFEA